jgi:2-keto-4-pentenoate hydratase
MTSIIDGATIEPDVAEGMAARLYDAMRDRVPIEPLTDERPDMSMADGYLVQQQLVTRLRQGGDRIVGYKLGLTSAPMQQMLGVDSPDLAPVLTSHLNTDGALVPCQRFIAPRVEAEIAFVLGDHLSGPDCTAADVLRATAGVSAAIEIVDSRITDWRIKLADTVADMASCGAIVLSGRLVPLDFDIRLVGMVFTRNGQMVATGAGAAALGNPAAAIAWLANTLHPWGARLEAGHIIMTGALHAAVPVAPGDVFRAEFDRLGSVTTSLT